MRRTRGLLVARCNPLDIQTLKDIAKKGARFINRRRGSGTHLALQRMMQEQGIEPAEINGYYTEEFTHRAVAAAIASGVADVGIGIEAAARRLNLDFIPLFVEDYYLLGKRETVERPDVQSIVTNLKSREFAEQMRGIPGCDTSRIGEVSSVSDLIGWHVVRRHIPSILRCPLGRHEPAYLVGQALDWAEDDPRLSGGRIGGDLCGAGAI